MGAKVKFPFVVVALLALAGCVETGSPGPEAKPAAAAGKIEPNTGMSESALVAVQGFPDGDTTLYGIFYQQARADQAQLKAAPAKLCASRGKTLVFAEDAALEHPGTLPGVRKLMVRCK